MNRRQFYDYLLEQGCTIELLNEHRSASQIKIINPINNRYAFLDLPIDNREVRCYTVAHICSVCLHINTPIECRDDDDIAHHINREIDIK